MKLKTLKDLETEENFLSDPNCPNQEKICCGHFRVNTVDLRQEAIKWIKSIQEGRDCEGCPVDKVPEGTFCEYKGCPSGDPQGCGIIYGLMLFFNLTEEELK